MRTGGMWRASGVHNGQVTRIPQRLQGSQGRMEAEKPIEIKHFSARNINRGAHRVVRRLAMWDHDVQAIGSATLEDQHDSLQFLLTLLRCGENRSVQQGRQCRAGNNGQCSIAKKDAASDGHAFLSLQCVSLCYLRSGKGSCA